MLYITHKVVYIVWGVMLCYAFLPLCLRKQAFSRAVITMIAKDTQLTARQAIWLRVCWSNYEK